MSTVGLFAGGALFPRCGLYDVSRRIEAGQQPAPRIRSPVGSPRRQHGAVAAGADRLELLWGARRQVFAVFFTTGMPSTTSVPALIFNPITGSSWRYTRPSAAPLFAVLVFATVVPIP